MAQQIHMGDGPNGKWEDEDVQKDFGSQGEKVVQRSCPR